MKKGADEGVGGEGGGEQSEDGVCGTKAVGDLLAAMEGYRSKECCGGRAVLWISERKQEVSCPSHDAWRVVVQRGSGTGGLRGFWAGGSRCV